MTFYLNHPIAKNILLLQGPVGGFFAGFHDYLLQNGADKVFKINFNGGDDFFYHKDNTYHYNRPFHELAEFYRQIITKHHIEVIYLFGDCRPIHKIALKALKDLDVLIYVFEEGYIRPHYITLEKGGVNGYSPLIRDIKMMEKDVRDVHIPNICHGYGFFKDMMFYAFIYFIVGYFSQKKYPFYKHHKPFQASDIIYWGLSYIRKPFYNLKDRFTQRYLIKQQRKKYFLVPLQVYNDSQVVEHSDYHDVLDFIEDIMISFSRFAPKDKYLVIKHHPLDRGHRQYKKFISARAKTLGIEKKVFYVHEISLPRMLRHACGTVVINSTVGLSSIFHGTAVKIMGRAFYDIKGLTYRGSLENFWHHPQAIDIHNFNVFKKYIIVKSQIYGSFYNKKIFYNK